jgi:hypothetical protein
MGPGHASWPRYSGLWDCLRRVWREEGPAALGRGVLPCSIWAFLYIGKGTQDFGGFLYWRARHNPIDSDCSTRGPS